MPSSRGPYQPRDRTYISMSPALAGRFFTTSTTWEEKAMAPHSSTLACKIQWTEGGAWWAAVRGVAKSRTRLSDFTFTRHSSSSHLGSPFLKVLYCKSKTVSFFVSFLIYYWSEKCYKPIAAKSLQSCPTLCNRIDGSPPGSPVPGILQARTLEWVAISFSNARK